MLGEAKKNLKSHTGLGYGLVRGYQRKGKIPYHNFFKNNGKGVTVVAK